MEENIQARNLGYRSADHWLTLVSGEAAFGTISPNRYTEYCEIFHPRRALTKSEAELLAALEHPADWEWLEDHGHLHGDHLTRQATDMAFGALDALGRL